VGKQSRRQDRTGNDVRCGIKRPAYGTICFPSLEKTAWQLRGKDYLRNNGAAEGVRSHIEN
jgi:hypothetical protein